MGAGIGYRPHSRRRPARCWLLSARNLRNVPGRKTGTGDAAWIAELVEYGLVRPSFVPPQPIRELHDLTRYGRTQIDERIPESLRNLAIAVLRLTGVTNIAAGIRHHARRPERPPHEHEA